MKITIEIEEFSGHLEGAWQTVKVIHEHLTAAYSDSSTGGPFRVESLKVARDEEGK